MTHHRRNKIRCEINVDNNNNEQQHNDDDSGRSNVVGFGMCRLFVESSDVEVFKSIATTTTKIKATTNENDDDNDNDNDSTTSHSI